MFGKLNAFCSDAASTGTARWSTASLALETQTIGNWFWCASKPSFLPSQNFSKFYPNIWASFLLQPCHLLMCPDGSHQLNQLRKAANPPKVENPPKPLPLRKANQRPSSLASPKRVVRVQGEDRLMLFLLDSDIHLPSPSPVDFLDRKLLCNLKDLDLNLIILVYLTSCSVLQLSSSNVMYCVFNFVKSIISSLCKLDSGIVDCSVYWEGPKYCLACMGKPKQ